MNDGRQLEGLVAFIEKQSLPEGFAVELNKRIFDEDGECEAELDVLISGKIGSAKFQWLIECRDRPSSGTTPISWIEQLVGRRDRLNIDKVSAVSTQKFSAAAINLARSKGIDLRHVKDLSKENFEDWFVFKSIKFSRRFANLLNTEVLFPNGTSPELVEEVRRAFLQFKGNESILTRVTDRSKVSLQDAFLGVIELKNLFDLVQPNSSPKAIQLHVGYQNPEDCFVFEINSYEIRVEEIIFSGEISIESIDIPLESVFEYVDGNGAGVISQTAIFEKMTIAENQWSVVLHKDLETEQTHVSLVSIDNRPMTTKESG